MSVTPPALSGAEAQPLLEFLGRRVTRAELRAERDRLMSVIAEAPAGPLLLYMPNAPAGVAAILAALALGREMEILDPRRGEEELAGRLEARPPSLVITLDLAATLDRLGRQLPPETAVLVARMADSLPGLSRTLFPLLPGSGLTRVPDLPAYRDLRGLPYPAATPEAAPAPGSLLFEGKAEEIALRQPLHPWLMNLPFADPDGLEQLFGNIAAGALTILSPRLDEKSLARIAKQAGVGK